jgi:hypothetical protein
MFCSEVLIFARVFYQFSCLLTTIYTRFGVAKLELGVAKWAEAYVSEEARVVPIRPGLVPGTSAQHLEWTLC